MGYEIYLGIYITNINYLTGLRPDNSGRDIVFTDVEFNYPARPDVPILQGLSLTIKKGMDKYFQKNYSIIIVNFFQQNFSRVFKNTFFVI